MNSAKPTSQTESDLSETTAAQTPPTVAPDGAAVDPAPDTSSPQEKKATPMEELEQQLKKALAERDANLENWQRSQAEFDNIRKRNLKEQEQERLYRNLPFVRDLLPALDNLQRALLAAKASHDVEQLLKGVQMVVQQFTDALAKHSVIAIEATGKPFDPNLHDAIQQVPAPDYPPLTVVQDVEQGYMLHDRVVRPSKVIVSKGPA